MSNNRETLGEALLKVLGLAVLVLVATIIAGSAIAAIIRLVTWSIY